MVAGDSLVAAPIHFHVGPRDCKLRVDLSRDEEGRAGGWLGADLMTVSHRKPRPAQQSQDRSSTLCGVVC